jgi:intein/homing endonuclease
LNNYHELTEELSYLLQFYTESQINIYTKGNPDKVVELYNRSQPKKVPIGSLLNNPGKFVVNSPDGWVPVLDCVEKLKDELYTFVFESGKTITASHDHLYQKPDLSWHYAKDLKVGDDLLAERGSDKIVSLSYSNEQTKVYDLSVDHENHRYYTDTICSHNTGKSLFLANLSVNFSLAGFNVVYVTLELSEPLVGMRIDSMVTGISTRDVFKQLDDVEMKVKMIGKKSGSLQIKYLPSGKTVNDIRSYLKEYEIKTGSKADVIVVDYMDLLMPIGKKISAENLFIKDKYVAEELRNLAVEKNAVGISAAQLNRCIFSGTTVQANGKYIRLDEVKVGDNLASNDGLVEVLEVLPTTKQLAFEVTTKSGKKIKCSAKHNFPTNNGLKSLESGLKVGDALLCKIDNFNQDSSCEIYTPPQDHYQP